MSSAGPTQKDRGLISARSCSATTPTTANSFTPAASGRGCRTRCLRICAGVLSPLGAAEIAAQTPRRHATTRFGSPLVLSRVHWVEPKLVAEITYLTWTADNLLRQTVYVGLREDKPADQVRRETSERPGKA